MATFKLRRFSNPDTLKAIDARRLTTFLGRFAGYFECRGVAPPADGDLDYEKLVAVLMTPDESVPTDMVDALYFVHEMADEDAMEKLLSAASEHRLELQLADDPTPADVAIAVWLAKPALLEKMHAESFVLRAKRFEYYSGATRRRRRFPDHADEKIVETVARLDAWFIEKKKGGDSKLFIFPAGDKTHILIKHGSTMRREGSIKDGKSTAAYFRPEVYDILLYDGEMDLLGLKAGTKGEKDLYREVIGEVLFGNAHYFARPFKLTLAPLRERGPEILNCQDVIGMASVALVEVRRFLGGAVKERQINQATDLFQAFGEDWQKRLGYGALVGATFDVTLGEGPSKRRRKVTISPPNYAKFDRDDADADIIEHWLRRRQIMPQATEAEFASPSTEAVADPGGSAAEIDGAPGLAASAR